MTSERVWDFKSVFMVLLGATVLTASLLLEPRPDEFTYLLGERFGGPCLFRELSGVACPQCGMTRSFVWAARGAWATAWHYSPGGFTLFLAIELTAVIGLTRWVRRTPEALRLSQRTWILLLLAWVIGLVLAPWGLRIAGLCPLP
jgi:hypothetical protein